MNVNVALFSSLLYAGALFSLRAEAKVQISSKSLKEASHFEFSGQQEWRYEVRRENKAGGVLITLQFFGLKPEDVQSLENFRDPRVLKVAVKPGVNNDAAVEFYLANRMNFFDYQTDQPLQLILDIYKEEKKKEKVVTASQSKVAKGIASFVSKKFSRSIASVDHPQLGSQPVITDEKKQLEPQDYNVLDVADRDYKRFNIEEKDIKPDSIIKSEREIYLPFPELVTAISPSIIDLESNKIELKVPLEENEENKITRLVLRLYKEDKMAVALKTYQFLKEKYPTPKYDEILHLMRAEIFYKLWKKNGNQADFESAMSLYKEHLVKYPDSPYKEKLAYFVGLTHFDRGGYVDALSQFQSAIKDNPKSAYLFPMKIAVAECLRVLKQDDRALEQLESIEKDPTAPLDIIAQARFRRGDVFFKVKKFDEAISEYTNALKKFPKNTNDAPNAYYNTAESYFRLKEYKKSLDAYRVFIQKYPNHDYTSYATNRVASLLEILGAPGEKVLGAYLESYYRYRGTPGSYISKIKISLLRFPNMKPKEVEATVKDAFSEMPIGKIEGIQTFTKLAVADGYLSRQEYDKAMDIYTHYYKQEILSEYLPLFKDRIYNAVTVEIRSIKSQDQNMEVVQKYLKNKDTWLKGNPRVDTDIYVGQAYEHLNLMEEANRLYRSAEQKISSHSPDQEKRRQIFENWIAPESVKLRVAAASLKAEDIKKADEAIDAIKNIEALSQEEKIEFGLVSASVAEKEGRFDVAIKQLQNLSELWRGKPELLLKPWLKISKIYDLRKNRVEAKVWGGKILDLISKEDDPAKQFGLAAVRDALKYTADLYCREGEFNKAIKIYKSLLENYADEKNPNTDLKYKLGKIYFDQKNVNEAKKIWSDLKNDPQGALWAKMADENLSQYTWSEKFKRYVDRKPASGFGGGANGGQK